MTAAAAASDAKSHNDGIRSRASAVKQSARRGRAVAAAAGRGEGDEKGSWKTVNAGGGEVTRGVAHENKDNYGRDAAGSAIYSREPTDVRRCAVASVYLCRTYI